MKHILRRIPANWLLVFFYCLLIFVLSADASPKMLPKFDYADKIIHFIAFTVLGILFFRAYRSPGDLIKTSSAVVLTLLSSTVFGIIIEIRQYFLPYRTAEVGDVVADALGSIAGLLIYLVWIRKKS